MRSGEASRTLDPAATRAEILRAATALFSECGYAATSLTGVAERAGVTKSLVLYHYASKEKLWDASLEAKLRPALEGMQSFLESDDGMQARMKYLVKGKFATLRQDPELQGMLAWASLEETRLSPLFAERARRVKAKFEARGHELNLPESIHPGHHVLSILMAIDGYFRFRRLYQMMSGADTVSPEAEDAFLEVILHMAVPDGEKEI